MENNVSVIIRCKNEERWIGHAMQSVLDFLDKPEIIVIDNNSTDDSRLVTRNFTSFDNARIVSIDEYTPGKALNMGVREATHDTILVLSAHCVLKQFDLPAIIKGLEEHVAVFGKQIPVYHGKKITPRYLWANFGDEPQVNLFSEAEKRYFLHNGFAVYKKSSLLEHPFDEELSGKEDRYWVNDMVKKDCTVLYDPAHMICDHHWTTDGNTWKGIG